MTAETAAPSGTASVAAIDAAAQRLVEAIRTRQACAPVRDLIGTADLAAAYSVQEQVIVARLEGGARVVGRKVGLTSEAVQRQLGVDQPDFGVLLDDMAYADGDVLPHLAFLQPRIEAEIAFVLAEDLAEGPLDVDQVRGAVGYAVAALEVCDSRIAGWDISFADTVADNASSGAYILGVERRQLHDFAPVEAVMEMTIDGEVASTGTGSACLGDPLAALRWLAVTARSLGEPLREGQVVLSGALGPMVPVSSDCIVTAEINGLGSVTARFSGQVS